MGRIFPDRMMREVIANEATRSRLQQREQEFLQHPFPVFLAECGVLDIGELTPSQVMAFVAARNLFSAIDLFGVPSGKVISGRDARLAYDLDRPKTTLSPTMREYLDAAPAGEFDFDVLRDPEDIPLAVPEDLLLRRHAPMEFLRRMTEGELLRSSWVHEDVAEDSESPEENPDEQSAPDLAEAKDERPFGYLLLDASESMATVRDGRNTVARGLAIAFLWSQHQLGNPTWLHLFRHDLSPAIGGEHPQEFHAAIAAVLNHKQSGMTNLQDTVEALARARATHGGRTDIVLITDGLSHLTQNPVGDAHLHTFLLGERPEEFDAVQKQEYRGALDKLKEWSEFFFLLRPEVMADAGVPDRSDVLALDPILESLEADYRSSITSEKLERIVHRARNLVAVYDKFLQSDPGDDPVRNRLGKAQEFLAAHGRGNTRVEAESHALGLTETDLANSRAIETRELRTLIAPPEELTSSRRASEMAPVDFMTLLRLIRKSVRKFLRSVTRRIGKT